jgi:hypothetical protein
MPGKIVKAGIKGDKVVKGISKDIKEIGEDVVVHKGKGDVWEI